MKPAAILAFTLGALAAGAVFSIAGFIVAWKAIGDDRLKASLAPSPTPSSSLPITTTSSLPTTQGANPWASNAPRTPGIVTGFAK